MMKVVVGVEEQQAPDQCCWTDCLVVVGGQGEGVVHPSSEVHPSHQNGVASGVVPLVGAGDPLVLQGPLVPLVHPCQGPLVHQGPSLVWEGVGAFWVEGEACGAGVAYETWVVRLVQDPARNREALHLGGHHRRRLLVQSPEVSVVDHRGVVAPLSSQGVVLVLEPWGPL